MLGDMHFLDTLKEFDKDNIPAPNIKKIRDNYINNKDFNPEIIKNVSSACEGLCKWVRAIDVYDSVAKASSVSRAHLVDIFIKPNLCYSVICHVAIILTVCLVHGYIYMSISIIF